MEWNYKKIGLVFGFIAVSIGIGWALYRLFFSSIVSTPPVSTPIATSTTGNQLPTAGIGQTGDTTTSGQTGLPVSGSTASSTDTSVTSGAEMVTPAAVRAADRLTDDQAQTPVLAANGTDILYYSADDDVFYRLGSNGERTALADRSFFNAQTIVWSDNREKAVIEYPDGANVLYDFTNDKQVTLPAHWEDFGLSPDGTELVAKSMGIDRENRWLLLAGADGSQARALEALGDNEATVYPSWSPNNSSVALFAESIDFDRQRLYFIGKNQENFKATIIEGRGFEHHWDQTGNRLLYSVYTSENGLKPTLWTVDANGEAIGGNRHSLNVQTWAHKCSFAANDIVYCAVPASLPEGAGVFPELAAQTTDTIYRINLATGAQTVAAIPDTALSVKELMIKSDEKDLYFTTYNSTGIYHIALP